MKKDTLNSLVSRNSIDEVFGYIDKFFIDTELEQDLILIKSRYEENKKQSNQGTIRHDDYEVTLNKIKVALLDWISKIPSKSHKKWDIQNVEHKLETIFNDNSDLDLKKLLQQNSFLFYDIYTRKQIQPNFYSVDIGEQLICDFAWLNDNSDAPEWVLVTIGKPKLELPSIPNTLPFELNKSIERVKDIERYFIENPNEKKRIFGAVGKFRFVLIIGDSAFWQDETMGIWRRNHNATNKIEIRTTSVFDVAIKILKNQPDSFWSFQENPKSLPKHKLEQFCNKYSYMKIMKRLSEYWE